jgi:hypothetical protein
MENMNSVDIKGSKANVRSSLNVKSIIILHLETIIDKI